MNTSRSGLEAVELATSRLLASVVQCELLRVRNFNICWLLAEDHIDWESFGVSNGDQ